MSEIEAGFQPLNWTKDKREKTQINKIVNERNDITTDAKEKEKNP